MGKFSVKNNERGQILLVVVLAAVISLTVGLSAIGRTITNTKVSIQETRSQQALSAAEAGIEKILNSSKPKVGGDLGNYTSFNATSTEVKQNSFVMNCSDQENSDNCFVYQDEGADIWLSDPKTFSNQWSSPPGNPLVIYWVDNAPPNCVAIEVSLLTGAKNDPTLKRYASDVCAGSRQNGFTDTPGSGGTILGKTYSRSLSINVTDGFIARVIPRYGNTRIAVTGASLPAQGYIVESTGTSGSTSRKVKVFKGYPRIPIEFFPYNLFVPL